MRIVNDWNYLTIVFVEEARRLSEERLIAEQAKNEVTTLRKHYSEADVNILFHRRNRNEINRLFLVDYSSFTK